MAQSNVDRIAADAGDERLPIAIPEIRKMQHIITAISFINLLIGLPSIALVTNSRSPVLFFTGLLCLLTYWLLRLTVKYISQSKSWVEVGVLAMCGIYFPSFIIWISSSNLIEAILR